MPGATGRLALPYPVSTDAADVPKDVKALADRVEALTAWIRNADLQSSIVGAPNLTPSCAQQAIPTLATTPAQIPSPAQEGDRVIFCNAAMLALGVCWELRYMAAMGTVNKWLFVGGAPLFSSSTAAVANLTGSYAADPAVSIALPLSGLYRVDYGVMGLVVGAGQNVYAAPSAGGGIPAVPADASLDRVGVAGASVITADSVSGAMSGVQFTGQGNLVRLYLKSSTSGASPAIGNRWLSLTPIALSLA